MKLNSNQRTNALHKWYRLGQRRCHCCGVQLNWVPHHKNSATFEHLVPKSMGGTLAFFNSIVICRKCNLARGNHCFLSWGEQNDFPKNDWLVRRYLMSFMNYRLQNRNLKCDLPKKYSRLKGSTLETVYDDIENLIRQNRK